MKKIRIRAMNNNTPKVWPNGSGLYKKGMAGDAKGLIGRTVQAGTGAVEAWLYKPCGSYVLVGTFPNDLAARLRLRG